MSFENGDLKTLVHFFFLALRSSNHCIKKVLAQRPGSST